MDSSKKRKQNERYARQQRFSKKSQDVAFKRQKDRDHRANLKQTAREVAKDSLAAAIGSNVGGQVGKVILSQLLKSAAAKRMIKKLFGQHARGAYDAKYTAKTLGAAAGGASAIKSAQRPRKKK